MFEIICKELSPERRKLIASREVSSIGKPLRIVLAVGGAWLFYYGTDGEASVVFVMAANAFMAVGIAAVLIAIFSHKLVELSYFAKTKRAGCFPSSVSVGNGGVFIRRATGAVGATGSGQSAQPGVIRANAERFCAYAEIGEVEDQEDYFKLNLLSGDGPGVFLFKEDFEQGEPEAFISFFKSRKPDA